MPRSADASLPLDAPVLQALLDIIPGTLHVKDRDLRYRLVNRYYVERWGLTPEDFIGKRSSEIFGDVHDIQVEARDRKVLESGEALPFYEVEYATGSGRPIALWATKIPILDAAGTPSHVLTLALDITPLKRAERALNESELVRAATVQRALDSIIVTDQEGTIVEFNPAAEQTFGRRREDVLGQRVDRVLIPDAHRAAHVSAMERFEPGSLAARGGRRFQSEALRADGTLFPVEIAVAEIPLAGRSLFTAYVRDLTEQKAVEAEVERQREALYQSSKLSAMGTLVASISHELRNPLSVVIGQALLLGETTGDPAIGARAQRIGSAAERCASIVRSFLDMARQRTPAMTDVDLDEVVDATLDLTGHLLRTSGVEIAVPRGPRLPAITGDPHQLGQVLMNLVVNAEQAMRDAPGPKRLAIATWHDAAANTVCVEIADSGPGFDDAVGEKLFTPFFTTRADAEGTGLGLAICSDIVAAHDGEITAESRPGEGARFRIALPVPARAERPPASAASAGAGAPRVLVVDDDPEVREMLAEMLGLGGYRVETAASAEDALRMLRGEAFDAVLSDVRMPGMSGIELYEAVARERPALAQRFAFVTGEMAGPAAHPLVRGGDIRRLEKPFSPAAALSLVRSLVD